MNLKWSIQKQSHTEKIVSGTQIHKCHLSTSAIEDNKKEARKGHVQLVKFNRLLSQIIAKISNSD